MERVIPPDSVLKLCGEQQYGVGDITRLNLHTVLETSITGGLMTRLLTMCGNQQYTAGDIIPLRTDTGSSDRSLDVLGMRTCITEV